MSPQPLSRTGRKQHGFSLLELIVSMAIFLIITASVYGLLRVGLIDRNRSSRRADILKNARAAMYLIGRDALNAGLGFNKSGVQAPDNFISARLGTVTDPNSTRDLITGVIPGNNLFTNILNPNLTAKTDTVAFAYRDVDFNNGNKIDLNNVSPSPGAPTSARLLPSLPNGAANSNVYDLYLVESDTTAVAVMATGVPNGNAIDLAPGDPLGLNQAFNGTGSAGSLLKKCNPTAVPPITTDCTTYVASARRFFWVAYKVKSDGTLVRVMYGNNTGAAAANQIQEMPLAYNIEDLQFSYVLEDGTVTDDPTAGADGIAGTADDRPSDANLIRQITVTLRVQATDNDEQTGKPDKVTLISTFATRNLEYDAG
jgi:prepilin-type N-terminal cleavage/methylation domain-containing protein